MAVQKVTLACAALCFLAASASAAVPLSSRTTCLDAMTQKTYSLGDTWYTTGERECMKLTCDGEDTISGLTCAPFQVPSWCSIKPGNVKAMYPDCCPTPVCPEENAIEGSTSEAQAKPEPHGKAQQPQVDAKPMVQAEAQPQAEVQAQPMVQAEAQPQAEVQAQPMLQAEAQPQDEIQAQPMLQAETQPQSTSEDSQASTGNVQTSPVDLQTSAEEVRSSGSASPASVSSAAEPEPAMVFPYPAALP